MLDLSGFNREQLRALHGEIDKEIARREKQNLENARERLYAVAHDMGMPLNKLLEQLGMVRPGVLKDERMSGPKKAPVKVMAKYRHPDYSSQEWTGRGRMPAWVKNWMQETGKPLEKLLIAA